MGEGTVPPDRPSVGPGEPRSSAPGSAFGPLTLIADLGAGRGAAGGRIPEVERELGARGLEYRLERAGGPVEVAASVRRAVDRGGRFLALLGDDRTLHQAMNAVIVDDRPVIQDLVIGMVPVVGSDFLQTFGLPQDVARACAHLAGPNVFPIDLGKVTCTGPAGTPLVRYFANLAQAGLGGAVAARRARLGARLGRAGDLLAFWLSLARFRPAPLRLVSRDRRREEPAAHNVFVANCQYYGGGMRISPRSWPGDGLLDVLVMTGPRSEAFTLLPKIYRGEHLPHQHIVELKSKGLTVEPAAGRPWPVEADGSFLGWTPATFEVIRQPLRLKI